MHDSADRNDHPGSGIGEDATRIEAELVGKVPSHDPFISAVRATRMPMVITNPRLPDNPIVFVNNAFSRLTGYPREEIVGRNCRFLQGPETNLEDVATVRTAVRERHSVEIDLRNYRRDGSAFWNRLLLAPVYDEAGELTYFFASQLDVTVERDRLAGLEAANAVLTAERALAEQRLALNEVTLKLAVDAAEIGTWDLDLTTDILNWPPRTKAMFGISPHVACSLDDFTAGLHPDDRDATMAAFASALDPAQRATYDVEYRTIGKEDGVIRWVSAKGRGIFDQTGRCVRAIGTAINITRTKATEERLRESEARLRDLNATLEQRVAESTAERDRMWRLTTDLMLVAQFDSTIVSINPAWTTLLGWEREELLGRPYLDFVHSEDGAATTAETQHLTDGRNTMRFENRYRHKDGSYRWLSWSAVPEDGLIHAVARDITSEKAANEALSQAQKMDAVGQLTGGIAHDFNNLLTVIRSAADFLRRTDLSEEKRRRYIDAISDTADRGARLTGQLLAFARRQPLKPEVFAVNGKVTGVAEMLRSLLGSRIVLTTEHAPVPLHAEADVAQFETALLNLAVNARDAMDNEGRLLLAVRAASAIPPVRRHAERRGDYVAVSVTDTGGGISTENLSRIFEPFFTTKAVGKGTGLGLSQVFGFAKQTGGDVVVESETGTGTTFTIYLKAVQADRESASRPSRAEPAARVANARVLVVEDNADVGEFATSMLQDLGYETTWAADAHAALDLLARDELHFDVVFTDVIMPGMSGIELGEEIRRRYPGLPVVLTSGYSHILAENGRHGFDLLQKPYSVEAMSRVLRKAVHGRIGDPES
ncbi:PAS domain S-box protein [Sphingomonas sp.]|jgi:PAS domain S-box-containing protein|uniref:PAS domain S-box protein n=1 Tax=Sphingomonas sp. TaxID=28214 RepID=UPI002ED8E619